MPVLQYRGNKPIHQNTKFFLYCSITHEPCLKKISTLRNGCYSSSPAFMPCIWPRQLRAYWIMVISKYLKYSLGLILFSIILNHLVICNLANHTFLLVQTMTWQDRQKEEEHRERFREAVTRGQADCWYDRREEDDEDGEEKDKEWQGKKKCRHHPSNIKP